MTGPMIALSVILGIILLILITLLCIILFGNVGIRIVCREKLRVVASVGFIKYTVISDKKKKKKTKELAECRNPDAVLQKELRKKRKKARKAEKKRLKEQKRAARRAAKKKKEQTPKKPVATPNLKENLDMISALLEKLYRKTRGKVRIHIRRMHITVGASDAAKTAILYGVILQTVSYILNFIEISFTHIKRANGHISVEPDYISGKCTADIDIACYVKIRRVIAIGLCMLLAFRNERKAAYRKAAIRHKKEVSEQSENLKKIK